MQIGIMTHTYSEGSFAEIAMKAKSHGFASVQLMLTESGQEVPTEALGEEHGKRVVETFARHGLSIAAVGGYTNLVDPNEERRQVKLNRLKTILKYARHYGSPVVCTETGSLNPESEWADCPENHEQPVFERVREVFAELVPVARDHGARIAIEGYVHNVVDRPERTQRLIDEFGAETLGVVMDPNNYIFPKDADRIPEMLQCIFDLLGNHILVAHAKDYALLANGQVSTPRAGTGIMDHRFFLKLLHQHKPDVHLILEHLSEAEVPETKAFIEDQMRQAGVE